MEEEDAERQGDDQSDEGFGHGGPPES